MKKLLTLLLVLTLALASFTSCFLFAGDKKFSVGDTFPERPSPEEEQAD